MKLARIELREIRMLLVAPFETSFGRTTERRILLVRVFDQMGAFGWGECTAPEVPFYNHESIDTAWIILRDFIAPMVLDREIADPSEVWPLLGRIRGNQMAKAAVETACWDLQARLAAKPLWQMLGGKRHEIECGVSIGLQPTLVNLLKNIETELAAGYRRIKLKIKPGQDVEMIRAARKQFPDTRLTVDANAAYRLEDSPLFEQLDELNLMFIEQPLGHDDLIDHVKLQARIKTPLCLDESIVSPDHARQAIEIEACRVINIKLGRVGGHMQAKKIHDYCNHQGVPVWCGGMLESGIGRAHNIALSTLEGFALPGDISASNRYWEQDIITPEVEVTPRGTIEVPEGVGIGYQVDEERIERLTVREETVAKS